MDSKIAIIDLDSVCYTIFHPNKVLDEFGIPLREKNKFIYKEKTEEEVVQSVDWCMNSILTQSNATHYIGFIKGKGNYRYDIEPTYKGNRSSEQPKHWELTKSLLISKWNAIEVNGIEVDDAVNITYRQLDSSFICAIDNDLCMLETKENSPHYNWRKQEWITVTKEQAEYKFWKDMITGQSGDNIKGCLGKGVKAVEKLFSELDNYLGIEHAVFSMYDSIYKLEGCREFLKNYGLLKILDSHESFSIPEVNLYKKVNLIEEELPFNL